MSNSSYTLKVPSGTTHYFWLSGHTAPVFYRRALADMSLYLSWNTLESKWIAPHEGEAPRRTLSPIADIYSHAPVTCRLEFEPEPAPDPALIPWELAPTATHFLPRAGNCGMYSDTFWRINPETEKVAEAWRVEDNGTLTHYRESMCLRVEDLIARPAPGWDGEGVPPVGTICEALACRTNTYRKCEVVAIRGNTAIVVFLDQEEIQWALHLRPLRTAAQRAADGEVEPLQWDGNGLPPVGIECEVRKDCDTDWHRVTILVHFLAGKTVAVYAPVEGAKVVGQAIAECFRPILTGRQRDLAKARELVVEDMIQAIAAAGTSSPAAHCKALYDAGFGHKVIK